MATTKDRSKTEARKKVIADLKEKGFLFDSRIILYKVNPGTEENPGETIETRSFDLLELEGVTKTELIGLAPREPKTITTDTVKTALSSGQLSIEDMEKMLKEEKARLKAAGNG